MRDEILVCPACLKSNRIEKSDLLDSPKCATCHADLLPDIPIEADTALFNRFNEDSTLPLVVDFWGAWSGSSYQMAAIFAVLAKRFKGDAIFIKVNSEREQVLAVRVNIDAIPSCILFKDGREYHRLTGDLSEKQVHLWLERYLRVKRKVQPYNPPLL